MSDYRFTKRKGVALVEETDATLKIQIDDEQYLIVAQAGSRGKRTQRMVQRLLMPEITRKQSVFNRAFEAMPDDVRDKVTALQKKFRQPGNTEEQLKQIDAEINGLFEPYLDARQIMDAELSIYEHLDPDQEEQLDHALLLGVQSIRHGSLEQEKHREAAFRRGTLHHLDILRDVVIEFNDFLGRSDSSASG